MPCIVCGPRARARSRNVETSGTWDYKWPLGTRVRVAFQKRAPSEDADEKRARAEDAEFSVLVEKIVRLAKRWEVGVARYLQAHPEWGITATDFASEGIAFDFAADRIFDPPLGDKADVPDGSEFRSPFAASDPAAREYDVLINLDNLPLVRCDPFRSPIVVGSPELMLDDEQEGVQHIALPFTALGCYARRIDYGLPTAFMGNPMSDRVPVECYVDSAAGAHIVVHEFGHILGLAHTHQAPQFAEASFRSSDDIGKILQSAFNIKDEINARFIREQITGRWPGNASFSDWQPLPPLDRLRSIMAHPNLPLMLNTSLADPETAGQEFAKMFFAPESDLSPEKRLGLTEPTDLDIESLLFMYGGRKAHSVVAERRKSKAS